MKLRTTPRLLIMDTPIPQAWTYSRTIVLSKGLLEGLDRGELAGVLAHEMVHWRRGVSPAAFDEHEGDTLTEHRLVNVLSPSCSSR
jgi:predicted Zn-dependent protease